MVKDRKVLDYHDVLLYESDLRLLAGEEWLNDQVINFWFEYLSHEKYASGSVCFVPGATTYLLANAGDRDCQALTEALQVPHATSRRRRIGVLSARSDIPVGPGQLKEQELVLLAVNDNPDVSAACGGSHWSLLVLSPGSAEARHYDTAGGTNTGVAKGLLRKLNAGLGLNMELITARSPQQHNGYDCGVYVLAMADLVCAARARGLDWQRVDAELCEALPPSAARRWRADVLALARALAAKAA